MFITCSSRPDACRPADWPDRAALPPAPQVDARAVALPRTAKRPSANASSSSEACKRWAASARALASAASIALTTAAPPICIERAPPWPAPLFTGARVGLHVADRLHRHAEPVGGDLGKGGLVALAVGLGADRDRHRAVALEAHLGALVGRAARGLEEAGDADAAQPAARLASARRAAKPACRPRATARSRLSTKPPESIVHAHRRLVREGRDQVLPPELGRIAAERARRGLDAALDDVVGLGLAGAAIGVDRHGVGEGAAHVDRDRRDVVDAAMRRRGGDRRGARAVGRQIGAEVGDHRDVERQEAAVASRPSLALAAMSRPCAPATNSSVAVGQPAHRPAELARRPQQQDPFGIEEVLHAEAAADIGRMQLDALERQLEDELGELAADAVQALPRQFEVHASRSRRRSGRCRRAARSGATTTRLFITSISTTCAASFIACATAAASPLLEVEGEIARRLVPERGRAVGERRRAVDDGGQRLVVDLDQLGRLARDLGAVGNDEGHRIADMAHAAHRRAPGAAARSAASPPPGRAADRASAARSAAV